MNIKGDSNRYRVVYRGREVRQPYIWERSIYHRPRLLTYAPIPDLEPDEMAIETPGGRQQWVYIGEIEVVDTQAPDIF